EKPPGMMIGCWTEKFCDEYSCARALDAAKKRTTIKNKKMGRIALQLVHMVYKKYSIAIRYTLSDMSREKVGIAIILILIGTGAGIYIDRSPLMASVPIFLPPDVNQQGVHYQFINPLLFCQDQNISSLTNSTGNQIQ